MIKWLLLFRMLVVGHSVLDGNGTVYNAVQYVSATTHIYSNTQHKIRLRNGLTEASGQAPREGHLHLTDR